MKIGVTGTIGSGKSEVSAILSKYIDAYLIDADDIGRKVLVDNYSLCERIAEGLSDKKILTPNGIDRKLTASIVFSDERKLKILNEIIHPPMLIEIKKQISEHENKHVVLDAALLLDWDIKDEMDFIVVVKADERICIDRLIKRGLSKEDAQMRISSQKLWDDKVEERQWIIYNNSTIKKLNEDVLKWCKTVNL